ASGVLDGVNSLFRRIMTLDSVGQDYSLEELSFGGGYPEQEGDVCFLDYEKEGKEKLPLGVYSVKTAHDWAHYQENAESVAVCDLVEGLVGKEEIAVNAQEKCKITYGDIAILYRSKSVALSVSEGLKRRDIPLSVEKKIPLTSSAEVSLLISALRLATGSREDIPFVNVLLSPLGKMQESELKEVRAYQKRATQTQNSFYHAAELFASRTGKLSLWEKEIQSKLQKTFALMAELSKKAEFIPANELMEELCVTHSLRAHAYAKPMGKRRVNMINRLIAEAVGTDGSGMFTGAFLHRIDTAGEELAYAETDSGDTVKMMTMHASKGLEFPVVILCGLHAKFNNQDETGVVLLDRELGMLPYAFDGENRTKSETLHRILFREAYRKNRAKEEMRLLYVAMTRAKNALYLARCKKEKEATEKETTEAANFMDWIGKEEYSLMLLEGGGERFAKERKEVLLSGGEEFAPYIENARAFRYPYPKAVEFPEKETVTGILARSKTGEALTRDLAKSKERESRLLGTAESRRERGVRIHAFMEKCDLTQTEESAVLAEMRAFVERGELIEEDLASAPAISRILSSPVMEEVRKGQIFREREFTMLYPVEGQESAVVQGVIDLLSLAEDGIIIVDYKNSTLSDEEIVATYKQQLDLYAEAAFRFYGIKIKKKVIINLTNESVLTV
ncbi:MAG: PD-(D/E)XK nuclease family protein, partial [Clostridia bacterium]|nr:PD-(D/E)XK nuclease family protein [Clostridia bacterium]